MKRTKAQSRLDRRIADYLASINDTRFADGKKLLRKETGGFHKPGSMRHKG